MFSFTVFVDLSQWVIQYSFVCASVLETLGNSTLEWFKNIKTAWVLEVSNYIMVKLFWTCIDIDF